MPPRRLPPWLVARPQLFSRLDAAAGLALLQAPAGFGKSTVVSHWLSTRGLGRDTVWVRAPAEADGSAGFWVAVLDALLDAGVPTPPLAADRSARGNTERMISNSGRPLVVVVDGMERVADTDVDEALLDLVWHTPQLRLIVTQRDHRHFRADACASLDPVRVGPRELLFTDAEIARLLAGAGLAPELAGAVRAETGGWPEPTATLVRAMRVGGGTVSVAGAAGAVAREFLRRRLLPESGRPDRVAFALLSAVADHFTAELAEQLTEDAATKNHLEWFEAEGMLHSEAGTDEPVYRWPMAARRALLGELSVRHPDRLPDLYSRLVRWYLDHGQPAPALEHALAAGDPRLTVEVLDAGWRPLLIGHRELLHRALVATPVEMLEASQRALAVRDVMLQRPDDRVLATAALPADPVELAGLGRGPEAVEVLDTGLATLVALRRRGLFDRAHAYAGQLLQIADTARVSQPAVVAELLPGLHLQVGTVRLLAGDLTGAPYPLQRAYELALDGPALPYVRANAAAHLALVHALLGEPGPATAWLARHDNAPDPDTWLEASIRTTAAAARMVLALDRLDLSAAEAAGAETLINRVYTNELWAYPLYARAQYALHSGVLLDILDQLDRDRALHRSWLDHGAAAAPLLLAAEADILLALGRGNQARAVLHETHADHPLLRVGQARLALLSGDTALALELAVDAHWAQAATPRHRLEMLLIHAVAAHRLGDPLAAAEALRRAVGAARATGSVRAFRTVPQTDLDHLAAQVPAARELLKHPGIVDCGPLFPAQVTLILLTEREQHLLHRLAEGRTIGQIARDLVVSPNTVKSQRRTLYQKLGATARADALARARAIGLLPSPRP